MTGGPPADQGGSAARRRRARLAALAGGLAVTVAACQPSPPGGQPSSPGDRPSSDQVRPGPGAVERHLIKYGQDIPYPQEVAADPAAYTRLPFDGIVLRVPASVDIFSPRAVDGSALLRDVSELPADLGDLERNWVRIAMLDELDWSDDALWDGIAANSAALAEAMRESGDPYVGVWFDNEFYGEGSSPWNYGEGHDPWTFSATDGATPGLQPEEARDLVRRRGAQVMAAMADAWPGLEVMVLFGPWFSAPASSPGPAEAGLHWNDLAWVAESTPPTTGPG
ncbi:hypothetical protein KZX45_07130 [Georgenia sp. EYE_87]|uniref:hypothetical protein n=1 Tax=Georgenia sp. EYE_87 TaxID=2853448 RepID=UPI0020041B2E|nr:hypothetical protein [Georgenia sp. EYE_87]MCK6210314.1 hypothetical protein [Georgenia sp. EYE_87]